MFLSVADDPFLTPISTFDDAAQASSSTRPEDRLRIARRAALAFREEMSSKARALCFRSVRLQRAPYPTRFGLLNACAVPSPYLHIVNRLFIVQVALRGVVKTVLLSPTNIDGAKETPFFKTLASSLGPLQSLGEKIIAPRYGSVPERLAELGIHPREIDYLSYDHLHTQDLRAWLGTNGGPGLFPNAKLLVMRKEWESAQGLLPTQAAWYCPHGLEGVDPRKVVLLDGDVFVGEGLAIVRTPGHTEGNHSFVTNTELGLLVTSENGIGPDAYAPEHSRIPGLSRYARTTGSEVVLNGNTLESSVEQYISMVKEKTIAGPSRANPDFPNVVSSSEFASYWAFPGLKPTFSFGDLDLGRYRRVAEEPTRATELRS